MRNHHPATTFRRRPRARGFALALSLWLAAGLVPCRDVPGQWRAARPGKVFRFPDDHHAHPDFRTEWWYFTGILRAPDGSELGYQVTWFREGIRPPGYRTAVRSRFVIDHLHFVHLAVSDLGRRKHRAAQVLRRGSHGEAGTGTASGETDSRLVWVGPCVLERDGSDGFRIAARDDGETISLDLRLRPTRAPVLNGSGGVSRKGPGRNNASHYYSLTRLDTAGEVRIDGSTFAGVSGTSWCDREWSTSALGEGQVGWDWFALRLDDGSDLMIYQLRRADGAPDRFSSGTLRRPDGGVVHLGSDAFRLRPGRTWTSGETGGAYPVAWRIAVPGEGLELEVTAAFDDQEVALFPVTYWEGAVRVKGTRSGEGYMELTGYIGEVPLH